MTSCKNENTENKILLLENEKLKKEIELNKLKDSLNNISNLEENDIVNKQNFIINNLDYIKSFAEKYPADVKLYEKGVLHDRIFKLLGKKIYQKFIDYSDVQSPIEIVNNRTYFGNGGAPHSFGTYESAILIDFDNNLITIALLDDKRILFFSENKSYKNNPKNVSNSDFTNWIFKAESSVSINKEYDD